MSSPETIESSAGSATETPRATPLTEPCLRCGADTEWRHGTWQCPRCRFKIGCCEGPTAECYSER